MAQEILTPVNLVSNIGPFREFNGNPLIASLPELSDGNQETGIKNFVGGVSPAEITFKMTSPSFVTFNTAIFQYQVEELGGGTKGTIITTLNGLQIDSFSGAAGNGDIKEVDISNLSIDEIKNGAFGFNIDVSESKISEVKIILTIIGGLVKLTQGQVELKEGKISI